MQQRLHRSARDNLSSVANGATCVVAQARLDAQPLASVAPQIQRDRLARIDVGLAVGDAGVAFDGCA